MRLRGKAMTVISRIGRRGLLALLATLALVLGSLVAAPTSAYAASTISVKVKGDVDYAEAYAFLDKLNKLRSSKGLTPLVMDKALLKAAEQRAAELSVEYSHTRPNGKKPASVSGYVAGENIAIASADAGAAYSVWKNSPPHYANMTRGSFRTAGVCCFESNGMTYWVNLFGTKKSGSVSRSSATKTKTRTVKVAKKYLTKKYLHISPSSMDTYDSGKVIVYFRPSFADKEGILPNSLFTFKSSKTSVLTVTKKGVLKSRKAGKAKLTVILKKKKSCKLAKTIKVKDSDYFDSELYGADD